MFSRRADNTLREFVDLRVIVFRLRVFVLRFYVPATDGNSIQFVRADATVKDFFATYLGIE